MSEGNEISRRYQGPGDNTPYVPSWLEEENESPDKQYGRQRVRDLEQQLAAMRAQGDKLGEALRFAKAALSQPVMQERTRTVAEKATAFLILRGDVESATKAIENALVAYEADQ